MSTDAPAPAWRGAAVEALRPHRIALGAIAFAFTLTRILAAAVGLRFDAEPLGTFWQYIDVPLLRHDLASSLWHFNYQPPLYNLFLGGMLKLFGGVPVRPFHLVYLAAGLTNAVAMYFLGLRLGLRRAVACSVAVAFTVTPTALLYENWLFYEYLVTVAITLTALALHRFLQRPTIARGSVFWGLVAGIVLTRTMFQWPWLALIVPLVLAALWPHRRIVAISAAVPLALVAGLYARNAIGYGVPATAPGYENFTKVALWDLPLDVRERYVREGKLGPLALQPENEPVVRRYLARLPRPARTGIPVLDEPLKSNGRNNFNNARKLQESKLAFKDAVKAVRLKPGRYLSRRVDSARYFFRPGADYAFFKPFNRDAISGWTTIADAVIYGRMARQPAVGRFLVLAYVIAYLFGALALLGLIRRRTAPDPRTATIVFLWATLCYVTVLSLLLELGENQRDRLLTEPAVWLLVAAAISSGLAWRRARRQPTGAKTA